MKSSATVRLGRTAPLEGKCKGKDIVYQARVKRLDTNSEADYVGLTSTTFKQRYKNTTAILETQKHKMQPHLVLTFGN